MLNSLLALAALTHVAPTLAKSPTCVTPLRPMSRVEFSTRPGPCASLKAVKPGELSREASAVTAYLSLNRSHWIPLNAGFEKVRGVRLVRIASPAVRAVKNWPLLAEDTTTLLKKPLHLGLLKMPLPSRCGLVSVQS